MLTIWYDDRTATTMKIAILTQPLYTNYGGVLQAFALQKTLRNMGHEVVTLDISFPVPSAPNVVKQLFLFFATFFLAAIKKRRVKDIYYPFNTRLRNHKLISLCFRPLLNRIMSISPAIKTEEQLLSYCREIEFDAYIVGSDQVWRPIYSPNIGWFFLDFLKDEERKKKLSYAASFGTDMWEFTQEQTEYLKPFAKRFDAISVREKSGVELCSKYFETEAQHVLDPTLLLEASDYNKLVEIDKGNTYSVDGHVFAYILDETTEKLDALNIVASYFELPVEKLSSDHKPLPPYADTKESFKYAPKPITQWLRNFHDCKFVVTDSFHGTVFSIIYNRPFVVFQNPFRGNTRIESLLNSFGLENRLIKDSAELTTLINHPIDWKQVNTILLQRREESCHFLIKNLS